MIEKWLSVVGFERLYSVSNQGRVRSEARQIMRSGAQAGVIENHPSRMLKPSATNKGHLYVYLRKDGKSHMRTIHILVLEAFKGPRPKGLWGLHSDDVKANNGIDNLYWGTPSQNVLDCVRNGSHHGANKIECKYGHPFTPENTITRTSRPGTRECRKCQYRRTTEYQARQRKVA